MKFLHNLFIPARHFLTLAAILLIGAGFLAYQEKASPAKNGLVTSSANACQTAGKTIEVTIKNNAFSPKIINAQKCDTLAIKNLDAQKRSPAFGGHNKHTEYTGFKQVVLGKNQIQHIHLTTDGHFNLHDDFHGVAAATLIVE